MSDSIPGAFKVVGRTGLNFIPGTLIYAPDKSEIIVESDQMSHVAAMAKLAEWLEAVESAGWKFRIERVTGGAA